MLDKRSGKVYSFLVLKLKQNISNIKISGKHSFFYIKMFVFFFSIPSILAYLYKGFNFIK